MIIKILSVFPALRHRNFRLFWVGQCISLIGTWLQNIGQCWLVLQLTGSSSKLGLVNALQFFPLMLLVLFAGVFIDRISKRKLLLCTQICLMILSFVLATLTQFRIVQYWHILILAVLLGMVGALDGPARMSFFHEIVGKGDLASALTLNSVSINLAKMIGPAFAGWMIGRLGMGVCFYLNTLSYAAAIAGIWKLDVPAAVQTERRRHSAKHILSDIKAGVKHISANPNLHWPLLLLAIISTFIMNYNMLIPIYVKQSTGLGTTDYGLLLASYGMGSLTGALVLAAVSKRGLKMRILLAGVVGASLFTYLIGIGSTYIVTAALLFIVGYCLITYAISTNTTVQFNADDLMRGRVMSIYTLAMSGVTPIGSLYTGFTSEYASVLTTFKINGIVGVVSSMTIFLLWRRSRKRMQEGR